MAQRSRGTPAPCFLCFLMLMVALPAFAGVHVLPLEASYALRMLGLYSWLLSNLLAPVFSLLFLFGRRRVWAWLAVIFTVYLVIVSFAIAGRGPHYGTEWFGAIASLCVFIIVTAFWKRTSGPYLPVMTAIWALFAAAFISGILNLLLLRIFPPSSAHVIADRVVHALVEMPAAFVTGLIVLRVLTKRSHHTGSIRAFAGLGAAVFIINFAYGFAMMYYQFSGARSSGAFIVAPLTATPFIVQGIAGAVGAAAAWLYSKGRKSPYCRRTADRS